MERSKLELWLLVEENFKNFFKYGLCMVVRRMYENEIIDENEYIYLVEEIQNYTFRRYKRTPLYTWLAGQQKPRKIFIQKQILKQIRCKVD